MHMQLACLLVQTTLDVKFVCEGYSDTLGLTSDLCPRRMFWEGYGKTKM